MATRTKPLVSAAALASVAAVAVATPTLAPSLAQPTPGALSRAAYELTTFSDVLSVPQSEWNQILFNNAAWGGTLSDTNYGPEWAKPSDLLATIDGQTAYVNPWAPFCAGTCVKSGITGVAYLFFDALINGDGNGWDPTAENPAVNWRTGAVNYFFEPQATIVIGQGQSPYLSIRQGGGSALTWYLLQGSLAALTGGQVPDVLKYPLAAAFWGPANLSIAYNIGLRVISDVTAQFVPVVGPFVGASIKAYLGDLADYPTQFGLSGVLQYWTALATGAAPWPTKPVPDAGPYLPAASAQSNAKAAPATLAAASAPAVADVAGEPAVDVSPASDDSPAADLSAVSDSPADASPAADSTPASDAPAESATDSTPAADAPAAVTAAKPTNKSAATAKHPVRDAVQKVTKRIASAISGAKAAKARQGKAASAG